MWELHRGHWMLAVAAAGLLSACGGGSGNDGDEDEPDNEPPLAAENCTVTPSDGSVTGFLQATDSDNSANELLFSLGDVPNNLGPLDTPKGTVELLDPTTGEYRYTPGVPGPRGADTFQFRVDDPHSFATGTETVVTGVRIMPLGNSITAGILGNGQPPPNVRVGYRGFLYDRLVADGYEIDLVGSERSGQDANPPIADPDHEAYGGATARDLAHGGLASDGKSIPPVFNALAANPADIVLLHIGTNELHMGDPGDVAGDIEEVLDEIDRWEDSPGGHRVSVFLAELLERTDMNGDTCNGCNRKVEALNEMIRNMPERRPDDELTIVDQHSAVSADCDNGGHCEMNSQTISDGTVVYVHPNTDGYANMADTWASALTDSSVLPTCD